MSGSLDPDTLQQLRTLLEHLECSYPFIDQPTSAALKRLLLTRIRALEVVQHLASEKCTRTPEPTAQLDGATPSPPHLID